MRRINAEVPGLHMANMVEDGATPLLPPARLGVLGYGIVAYPLTLLSAAMRAMIESLDDMKAGRHPDRRLLSFRELRRRVGFDDYDAEEERYDTAREIPRG